MEVHAAEIQRLKDLTKRLEERCSCIEGCYDDMVQEGQARDDRMRDQEKKLQQAQTQQRRCDAAYVEALEGVSCKVGSLDSAVKSLHEKAFQNEENIHDMNVRHSSALEAFDQKTTTFLNRVCDHLKDVTAEVEALTSSRTAQETDIRDLSQRLSDVHDEMQKHKVTITDTIAVLTNEHHDSMDKLRVDTNARIETQGKNLEAKSASLGEQITRGADAAEALSERVRCVETHIKKQRDPVADALQEARRLMEDQSKATSATSSNVHKLQAQFEEMQCSVDTHRVSIGERVDRIQSTCDDIASTQAKDEKRISSGQAHLSERVKTLHTDMLERLEAHKKGQTERFSETEKQAKALQASLDSIEKLVHAHEANEKRYATEDMLHVSIAASADEQKGIVFELRKELGADWKSKLDALSQNLERLRGEHVQCDEEGRKRSKDQLDRTKALQVAAETASRNTASRFEELTAEIERAKKDAEASVKSSVEPLKKWKIDFPGDVKTTLDTLKGEVASKLGDLDQLMHAHAVRIQTLTDESAHHKEKSMEMARVGTQCMERFEDVEQIIMQMDTNVREELEKLPTRTTIAEISRDAIQKERILPDELIKKQFREIEEHMMDLKQRVVTTASALESTCRERKEEMQSGLAHLTRSVDLIKENFTSQVENLFKSDFADQVFREMTDGQKTQISNLESTVSAMVALLHKPDTREARRQLMPLSLGAKNNLPNSIQKPH